MLVVVLMAVAITAANAYFAYSLYKEVRNEIVKEYKYEKLEDWLNEPIEGLWSIRGEYVNSPRHELDAAFHAGRETKKRKKPPKPPMTMHEFTSGNYP